MKLKAGLGVSMLVSCTSKTVSSTMAEKNLTRNGHQIERVSALKYLGFLTDDHLSFKEHILYVVKKLTLLLGFY